MLGGAELMQRHSKALARIHIDSIQNFLLLIAFKGTFQMQGKAMQPKVRRTKALAAGILVSGLITLGGTPQASAATLGGVGSGVASTGACNYSFITPLNTVQDTYTQNGGTACGGETSSVALSGDASTATISNAANSSGNKTTGSSSAFGTVQLTDTWLVSAPSGTPALSYINIPVEISIEGSVSPGSQAYFESGFLSYNLKISDKYDPLLPGNNFTIFGNITTTGIFSETFFGNINLYNYGSDLMPIAALVEMLLDSAIYEGAVSITSSMKLILPDGFTAKTSSGIPLEFGTSGPSPVPLPAALPLFAAGLSAMGFMGWRKKRRAA